MNFSGQIRLIKQNSDSKLNSNNSEAAKQNLIGNFSLQNNIPTVNGTSRNANISGQFNSQTNISHNKTPNT